MGKHVNIVKNTMRIFMNKLISYIFNKHEILNKIYNEKLLNNWIASKIKA